jgi:anti-anti-sigma factor
VGYTCDIDLCASGPVARVVVTGEIDMACADHVHALVIEAAQREGVERVVTDLAGVTFLDSSGITALVTAKQALEEAGQGFTVAAVPADVARLLKITGVDDYLANEP